MRRETRHQMNPNMQRGDLGVRKKGETVGEYVEWADGRSTTTSCEGFIRGRLAVTALVLNPLVSPKYGESQSLAAVSPIRRRPCENFSRLAPRPRFTETDEPGEPMRSVRPLSVQRTMIMGGGAMLFIQPSIEPIDMKNPSLAWYTHRIPLQAVRSDQEPPPRHCTARKGRANRSCAHSGNKASSTWCVH